MVDVAGRVLTIYSWALMGALLLFLYAIARFYQRTAHERSHYRLFLVPLVIFLAAAVRYAWLGRVTGDVLGDLLLLLGGVSLFALGSFLNRLMMGRRR